MANPKFYTALIIVLLLAAALQGEQKADGLPACQKSELTLDQGPADAAMSHVELTFYVKNRASKACALPGTAYVRFRNAKLRTLESSPSFEKQAAEARARRMPLEAGRQAQFTIRFATSGPFPPGHCPGVSKSAAVLIEGFKLPLIAKINADACSPLEVSAFELAQ